VIRGGITVPVVGYGYVSRMVPTLSSAEPAEAAFTYREQAPPPALAPWVRCLWELTVQGEGAGRAGGSPATLAAEAPATSSVPPAS
jgi:hypothetical protein